MVGCHGFAPCSRRVRAGTSLSKFATRRRRDAKAELNRRRQACEVLADTGIRVARKWPAHRSLGEGGTNIRGSVPCIPVWKVLADAKSVCLSTLMLDEIKSGAGVAPLMSPIVVDPWKVDCAYLDCFRAASRCWLTMSAILRRSSPAIPETTMVPLESMT